MGRPPIARNLNSRTRLLNSLGMFQEKQQRDEVRYLGAVSPSMRDSDDGSSSNNDATPSFFKPRHLRSHSDIPPRSALHNTVAFQTRLNDENTTRIRKENRSIKPRRSSFSGKDDKGDKDDTNDTGSVRFNTVVLGVKIPSRNQYSRRIKQTLWRDRYELSEMVERNTAEFHAENYDWQQVVLDDEMFLDSTSGEKVHPCHVEGFDYDEENDEDYCDDSFGDGPGFAPLTRSNSVVGEK